MPLARVERGKTQMCECYTDTYTQRHLNKRSNSFINNYGKCVLRGAGAADLTVATALMNNRQQNQ